MKKQLGLLPNVYLHCRITLDVFCGKNGFEIRPNIGVDLGEGCKGCAPKVRWVAFCKKKKKDKNK